MRAWRVVTAPFRVLWHLLDPQTQADWGYALNEFVTRRLGARATLLPPAIFMGLLALGLLLLPRGGPLPWILAMVMLAFTVYLGGLYVMRLVNGEDGREERGIATTIRRPPPTGIRALFDRFGSPAQRLARRGDIPGLLALARSGPPEDRSDAINRVWGLLDKLTSSDRAQFATIARSAVRDADAGVRAQAVFAVGQLKDASDVEELAAALGDSDWLVRLAAAYALSWQDPPRAITSIGQLLDDQEAMVREQVAGILQDLARESADAAARKDAIACLDAAGLPLR
jgi:HEAT repeats